MWFTNLQAEFIQSITMAGVIRPNNYVAQIASRGIAVGSDGALWVAGPTKIVRITTDGVRTEFAIPTPAYDNTGGLIIAGSDGALWYSNSLVIGRVSTNGV